jgi:hypothetical protein
LTYAFNFNTTQKKRKLSFVDLHSFTPTDRKNRSLDGVGGGVVGVIPILMMQDLTDGTGRFSSMQGVVAASLGFGQ